MLLSGHFNFARERYLKTRVQSLQSKIFISLLVLCLFRATPAAYGGSQGGGPYRAVATSLHHSHHNARSEPHLQPTPQLTATPDL